MSLERIARFATALGAIVSAASLVFGFQVYQNARRDDRVIPLRNTIAQAAAASHNLNRLYNYDMAHELVASVVYSPELTRELGPIQRRFFSRRGMSRDDLQKYLEHDFPVITVPVHSSLAESFGSTFARVNEQLSPLQADYPATFRVLNAPLKILERTVEAAKRAVRDDDAWRNMLLTFRDSNYVFADSAALQREIAIQMTGSVVSNLYTRVQPVIDVVLEIIDLVADRYLTADPSRLYALLQTETRVPMRPMSKTKSYTEDLREAAPAMDLILSCAQIAEYDRLVSELEKSASRESDGS